MRFTTPQELLSSIKNSKFRSHFKLQSSELDLIQEKGLETIKLHARDFINTRLAPAFPKNDGQQTPAKKHPVFIAQHATGTCCRSCLEKWHSIRFGTELNEHQKEYILNVIMWWIQHQVELAERNAE